MRFLFLALLVVVLAAPGCGGRKAGTFADPSRIGQGQNVMVTPSSTLIGKVVSAYAQPRFVVLNFPINKLPALEQRMNVYRQGLKVGEVKITGPQRDDNIVADIISGEAGVGDEVRDR